MSESKYEAAPPQMVKLLKASEPKSVNSDLNDDRQDELFTIQGFVPKSIRPKSKDTQEVVIYHHLLAKPSSEQAKYFLNVFWEEFQDGKAAAVYSEWEKFVEIQKECGMKEDASDLPQTNAQRYFETKLGVQMTNKEYSDAFKTIDANFDGKMAFVEFLCWRYKKTPGQVIYQPTVQSPAIGKKIKAVLDAQREIRAYRAKLAKLENDAATLTGIKQTRAKQEVNMYKENADEANLTRDLVRAQNALYKHRATLELKGDQFWADTVAAQSRSRLSQRAQQKA